MRQNLKISFPFLSPSPFLKALGTLSAHGGQEAGCRAGSKTS